MPHLILPHEVQIALERFKSAVTKHESLTAQVALAGLAADRAKLVFERAIMAAGLQENDEVTDDYRVRRAGQFVDAPTQTEQALADTKKKEAAAHDEAALKQIRDLKAEADAKTNGASSVPADVLAPAVG